MSKSIRRWVVLFILPLFVFSLYPQKKSNAIIPLVAPIAIALLDAAGSVVTANALASVGTALLGGIAFGMIFMTPGDTSNVNGQVRLPTTTAAGSTSAMTAIAPSAPSTASPTLMYQAYCTSGCGWGGTGFIFTDAISAANQACTNQGRGATGSLRNGGANWACAGGTYFNDTIFVMGSANICPSGYTVSGSVCNLSNARAATPDRKADFQRSGVALSQYTGDDTGNLKPIVSTTTTANDTVTVSALDSSTGLPRRISVQATADGGSKVLVQTQAVDGYGNSYTDNQAITVSAAGTITGASRTPTSQVLTVNTTTGGYDVAAAPAASATPAGSAAGSGTSNTTVINFPTDYARDATVASIGTGVTQLHTDSQQLHTDLTSTSASAPADPAIKTTDDISGQLLDNSFSSLKAWSFPARSVACPTPSFSIWSQTFTIDAHCTLWGAIAGQIQAISLVTWALMAMFIVLGA